MSQDIISSIYSFAKKHMCNIHPSQDASPVINCQPIIDFQPAVDFKNAMVLGGVPRYCIRLTSISTTAIVTMRNISYHSLYGHSNCWQN